jgi:peptidoglycan/LPS O-acetylase OafA/YrhL
MQQPHATPIVYMPQLDALRVFAVAAVAYSHWVPDGPNLGVPWGSVGVQLFFVLSGFLITDILIRARKDATATHGKTFALRSFYARRFLRIFPLYYAMIVLGCAFDISPFRETLAWTTTYTVNFDVFLRQQWNGSISHFWSLAVEEQFYLVWPLLVLCVPAARLKAVVLVFIALAVAFRLGSALLLSDDQFIGVLPIAALDALGGGALLAVLGRSTEGAKGLARRCLLIGAPCFFAFTTAVALGHSNQIVAQLQHLSSLLVYVWLIHGASVGFSGVVGGVLCHPVLVSLGTVSYGLYVLHNLAWIPWNAIARRVSFNALVGGPLEIVGLTALTVGGAYLSWFAFERPINSLKRYFPYRPVIHSESASSSAHGPSIGSGPAESPDLRGT